MGTPAGRLGAAPDTLGLAVDAYARGALSAARVLLEPLQQETGLTGGRAAYLLGVVNLLQKRFPEAAGAFDRSARMLPVLADHAAYYQAVAVFDTGDFGTAAQLFQHVVTAFPGTTLRGLALFWRAESLWGAHSLEAPDAFHRYLEEFADGRHAAQAWFEMGAALEQQGKWADTAQAYRRVGWGFASSPYAGQARARLDALAASHRLPPDATPPEAVYRRARSALGAGDWRMARAAFERILSMPGGWILADEALYNLGVLAFDGRSHAVAAEFFRRDVALRQAHADDSLYYLERIALAQGREADALAIARTLARDYPKSSLAARGFYLIAEAREDRGALGPALGLYREAADRFPASRWGSQARWRIGWVAYRQRQWAGARADWLRLAEQAPDAEASPAGLYWAARAAAALGRADLATDGYRRAAQTYPDTYYGQMAASRLGAGLRVGIEATPTDPPAGEIAAFDRFKELDTLAQVEDAVHELEVAAKEASPARRVQIGTLLSRRYAQQDQVNLAIQTAEQARLLAGHQRSIWQPVGRPLPLALWEALYPRAQWDVIGQASARAGADPYLVAGVIREESRFDPQAVSSAGAYGLMQLIPGTARSAARDLGMPPPDLRALADPATNIALGTVVLAAESRRFGRVDLALAAYNAGPEPVRRWLAQRGGMEADAFVEEIPYDETRNYVKTVLQSAAMYRWLYRDGHP